MICVECKAEFSPSNMVHGVCVVCLSEQGDPDARRLLDAILDAADKTTFYVLIHRHGSSVKSGELFRMQQGDKLDWGKDWEKIDAPDLFTARVIAHDMRIKRYGKD